MKTERRHELQHNDLAVRITQFIEKVKPYSSTLTLGVIVAAVVIIGATVYKNQRAEKAAAAWEDYFEATEFDPLGREQMQEKLRETAQEHAGTAVEDWALLTGANQYVGAASFDRNKSEMRKRLNAAASDYRNLQESATSEELRQQATFNLAITYEMLSNTEKACEEYLKVRGALAKIAQERAENLKKSDDLREFYDWYAKAEPRTTLPTGHPPLDFSVDDPIVPKSQPGTSLDLPDGSPLSLPNSIDEPVPSGGDVKLPSVFDEPSSEGKPPEPPAEEPSGDAPQPDAPASEKPE